MIEKIKDNPVLLVFLVAMLIALFSLKKLIAIYNKRKELESIAQDKLREEKLDDYIINKAAPKIGKASVSAKPFQEDFDSKRAERSGKALIREAAIMVQIIETKDLSSKKYMLDPAIGIYIGSNPNNNNIIVTDSGISAMQCIIKEKNGIVVVRNIGDEGNVLLSRKSNKTYVERIPIEIRNGDVITIGRSQFKIELIKA